MNSHTNAHQQRRSLLSKGLAGENSTTATSISQQQHQQQQQQQQTETFPHHQHHVQKYQSMSQEHPILCINEVISEEDANNLQYIEHPEPQLLASSVGKDLDGKLIPSSSTISLLSLNQDVPPRSNEQSQQRQQQQQQQLSLSMTKTSRTTSYSNLQRLQPYQRAATTSPPFQQHHSQQSQVSSRSSPEVVGFQPFAMQSNYNTNMLLSIPGTIPSSPNLDPVSLGGSPSRFWLSAQTPPTPSTNMSRIQANSQTVLLQLLQQHLHFQPQYFVHKTRRGSTNKVATGDDSPVLNPVQTPIEDPPMTPLFLSNTNTVKHVDYFTHYHPNHSDLKEEALEEEEDIEDGLLDRGGESYSKRSLNERMVSAKDVYS